MSSFWVSQADLQQFKTQVYQQALDYAANPNKRLPDWFPNLKTSPFEITGHATPEYNCIAWAAGDITAWWWPVPPMINYWPDGAAAEETLQAFIEAFSTLGYSVCDSPSLDKGLDKVAIYVNGGKPTHAARQLPDGRWSSKLGKWERITHELDALTNSSYGQVAQILSRPIPGRLSRLLAAITGFFLRRWAR